MAADGDQRKCGGDWRTRKLERGLPPTRGATLSWLVPEKHIFFVFQVMGQGVDSPGVFANASGVVRTLARKYRS